MTLEQWLPEAPVAAVLGLLFHRIGRMEGHQELIMRALKIEPIGKAERRRTGFLGLFLVLTTVGLGPFVFHGCAFNRPYMSTEGTNGTRQITKATTFALWPASTEVSKQRVSSGKTQSIGQEGLDQQSGLSTNDAAGLDSIRRILGR